MMALVAEITVTAKFQPNHVPEIFQSAGVPSSTREAMRQMDISSWPSSFASPPSVHFAKSFCGVSGSKDISALVSNFQNIFDCSL